MLVEKKNSFLATGFVIVTAFFAAGGFYVSQRPEQQLSAHGVFVTGEALLYLLCLAGAGLLVLARQRREYVAALKKAEKIQLDEILKTQREIEQNTAALQKKKAEHFKEILNTQRRIVGNISHMQIAFQTIVQEIQELLGADGCVIAMLEGEQIVHYAVAGTEARFVGLRHNMKGSISGLCMEMGTILKCDDAEIDERVDRAFCQKTNVRSVIVVPLSHRNVSVGVLKITSPKTFAFSDDDVATMELMAGLLSAIFSDVVTANTLRINNLELSAKNISLHEMATTDGLTGLQNRRMFQDFMSREYDLAVRHKRPLSLIIMDVDYFKKFNDSFGHPAGDAVLKRIGVLLKQLARKTDCVGRYGGEEFVLLLPQTGSEDALMIANRIQQTVADEKWEHRGVTVSVGVSSLGDSKINNVDDLLKSADMALYAAKEGGRNRVVKYA